ncbi:MAG: tetratricopeptide repeat protein, partial [Haliscomenobacter sp.]
RLTEEYLAKNPGLAARKLYQEGKYSEAIEKYKEAIGQETDSEKLAEFYFGMASIQFRQLKAYSAARDNARKAASYKQNWGRPYMLIGDMYAASSRNCGSDGYTRGLAVLAAIDKYSYARSIDSEVAGEASKKISLYSASVPPKDDVFMRGAQNTTVTVPCWIGERVTLRY